MRDSGAERMVNYLNHTQQQARIAASKQRQSQAGRYSQECRGHSAERSKPQDSEELHGDGLALPRLHLSQMKAAERPSVDSATINNASDVTASNWISMVRQNQDALADTDPQRNDELIVGAEPSRNSILAVS